jgi:hypothetical protein
MAGSYGTEQSGGHHEFWRLWHRRLRVGVRRRRKSQLSFKMILLESQGAPSTREEWVISSGATIRLFR